MARSIVSLGILPALASMIAYRNRKLAFGSPPPLLAATMIALASLLHSLPRLLSINDFLRAILAQCECPAIWRMQDLGYGGEESWFELHKVTTRWDMRYR